jgi:hypothetical protein
MRKSNFALRLQPNLLEELRRIAAAEGVALNQLINVAVAEKLSALRTEEYFRDRAIRGNRAQTLHILEKAGTANSPTPGDELPMELASATPRKAASARRRSTLKAKSPAKRNRR